MPACMAWWPVSAHKPTNTHPWRVRSIISQMALSFCQTDLFFTVFRSSLERLPPSFESCISVSLCHSVSVSVPRSLAYTYYSTILHTPPTLHPPVLLHQPPCNPPPPPPPSWTPHARTVNVLPFLTIQPPPWCTHIYAYRYVDGYLYVYRCVCAYT